MNRKLVGAVALLCFTAGAWGQKAEPASNSSATPEAKPAEAIPVFQAVDVHPSPPAHFQRITDVGWLQGDRFWFRQASMTDMIAYAYDVDPRYVAGGPTWLDMERFDLRAKATPGIQAAQLKLMMRGVLKDRFGLVVHDGSAPMPVYALRLANAQTKLKEAADGGDSGCSVHADTSAGQGALVKAVVNCHNQTTAQFVEFLQRFQGGGYLNKPVIDATGLKDKYDFELKFSPSAVLSMAGADGVSLFDALQNQVGLKLAAETAPRTVLIVDSVNETPTANIAAIEKLLPPAPSAQFEVATIKPSKPDTRQTLNIRGAVFTAQGLTLKDLMIFAFNVNPGDTEGLIGAPAWLSKDKFDIQGKVAGDDNGSGKGGAVDFEQFQHLLIGLMEDRFKLKSRTELRPVTVYSLVSAGPKLKPAADPRSRMKCTEGAGPDGKDPRQQFPTRNRLMWCQNMTMATFAYELQYLANGFVYYPVEDKTGLKGGYDFALNFTSVQLMGTPNAGGAGGQASIPAASASAAPSASDPNGAISLFDAVRSELGLKLEKEKRPELVLVIDHIEEQPTEN